MASVRLGGGVSGDVYKELFRGQWCAVKKIPIHNASDEYMKREYEIYKTVNHQNVVKLVAAIEKHKDIWKIPLEYIDGQTQTLEYGTFRAVIIDLGFAKFQYGGFSSSRDKGNDAYAAPEIIHLPHGKRNKNSDVWAMGKIVAELLVGYQIWRVSTARIQDLLKEHSGYREPVTQMLEGTPIPRATMASVIAPIREAQRRLQDSQPHTEAAGAWPVVRPRSPELPPNFSSTGQAHSAAAEAWPVVRPQSLNLPPNFRLPNPLPPNHTLTLNYITTDSRGRFVQIKGEIKTKHGAVQDVWWLKCEANESEMRHLPQY